MTMRPHDHEYLRMASRPVSAVAKDCSADYVGIMHSHAGAQFLYAASGSMKITLDVGHWIIPPQRAVWLPPSYPHLVASIGPVKMRTLYIRADACPSGAPGVPRMIGISPLLRELVLRTIRIPFDYDEQGQDARIIAALLGEIDWTPLNPVSLPPLHDKRLQRMEEMLMRAPDDRSTLDQWAERLEVSPRTLTRLFRREAHLSFQAWRDQIRAFAALPLIAERRPLAEIAENLGYETAWSFTSMFKRVTGEVPSRYFSAKSQAFEDSTDLIGRENEPT